jgi:hypothetical protein
VVIGQTIALDIQGNWWRNWWRRRRGYAAFATEFYGMIEAETDPIVTDLKTTQAGAVRAEMRAILEGFLDEQRQALLGFADHKAAAARGDVLLLSARPAPLHGEGYARRTEILRGMKMVQGDGTRGRDDGRRRAQREGLRLERAGRRDGQAGARLRSGRGHARHRRGGRREPPGGAHGRADGRERTDLGAALRAAFAYEDAPGTGRRPWSAMRGRGRLDEAPRPTADLAEEDEATPTRTSSPCQTPMTKTGPTGRRGRDAPSEIRRRGPRRDGARGLRRTGDPRRRRSPSRR